MTLPLYADRVRETTTTSGTGTVNLAGAVASYESFATAFASGQLVAYCLVDTAVNAWEVGYGTFTAGSPNTLSRTTVFASSAAGANISLSGGTVQVFNTAPAYFANNDVRQSFFFGALDCGNLTDPVVARMDFGDLITDATMIMNLSG